MRKFVQLFVIYILITGAAFARIAVKPVRVEITAEPGQIAKGHFIVKNFEKHTVNVEIKLISTSVSHPDIDWIKLDTRTTEIQKNKMMKVFFEIKLPKNATGEYSARINFTEQAPQKRGSKMLMTISIPIYVIVKGDEKYNVKINKISINNTVALSFIFDINNKSNVHIRPSGRINITSLKDPDKKYTTPFNAHHDSIKLETKKKLIGKKIRRKETLPDGKYQAEINIIWAKSDAVKPLKKVIFFEVKGNSVKTFNGFFYRLGNLFKRN